jgi:hypothetical protein
MYQAAVIGCSIIVGMSMIVDPSGTVKLVVTVITTRGITWIVKKITASLNKDMSDIINFAGWSIAGVAMVKIVKNAKTGVEPALALIGKVGEAIGAVGTILNKVIDLADQVTFWN